MTHIDEDGIERRHHFLDTTVVDIAHSEVICIAFLARHFLQAVVLRQRYSDLCRLYVNNQFAFHT